MPSKSQTMSSSSKTKSSAKRSASSKTRKNYKKKQVKIYSPKNEIRQYSLNSSEKREKRRTKSNVVYRRCKRYPELDEFPCQINNTVFQNMGEFEEFNNLLREKRLTPGYINPKIYRDSMVSQMKRQGTYKRSIPSEERLYDIDTGIIYDLRDYMSK
jgi:hypothetical protein